MKYSDISGLSLSELVKKRNELRESLFESRMKNALGQLSNPLSIRQARRDIARINTALRSKELQK